MLSECEQRTSVPRCSQQQTRRANGASPCSLFSPFDRAAAPDLARVCISGLNATRAGTHITATTYMYCDIDTSGRFKMTERGGGKRLNMSPLCSGTATRSIVPAWNGTLT
jgi:hypothetical protein